MEHRNDIYSAVFNTDNTIFDKMRTVKLNGKKVELFDNIEDLPITRFHKYNKYLLVDVGVGADLGSVDNHIERAMRFMKTNQNDALKELECLRQCMYLINSEVSPKHYAFAALVKSIDGVEQTDLSENGIKQILEALGSITVKETDTILESVKKKIDDELTLYFPSLFEDANIKEFYDDMKHRAMCILDQIIEQKDNRNEIERITERLILYTKPKIFWGKESVEIAYDKDFENLCLWLSQHLNTNPKNFTVLQYYNAFVFLKEQNKKANQTKRK